VDNDTIEGRTQYETHQWSVSPHNYDEKRRSTLSLPESVAITDLTLREGRQIAGLALTMEEIEAYAERASACGINHLELFNVLEEITAVSRMPGIKVQVLVPPTEVLQKGHTEQFDKYVTSGAHTLSLVSFVLTSQNSDFVSNILGERASAERVAAETSRAIAKCRDIGVETSVLLLDFLRADLDTLLFSVTAAVEAGADIIRLDDCCGPATPSVYRDVVGIVRRRFPGVRIAIHSHNDFGLALATQLAALEGGADIVEGSVLGLGEKAGVADITLLASTLEAFYGYKTGISLSGLLGLSEFVSDVWREPISPHAPGIGRTAFSPASDSHYLPGCGTWTWNSWSAETVGNSRYVPISQVTGCYALIEKARELGEELAAGPEVERALREIMAEVRVRRTEPDSAFLRQAFKRARTGH
jgi:isopropylmalate/homocitrate/citramalate synthase